ncbi:hypothetical protein [Flavobacterium sp.]|uniref:hypothetical protein n=1 Tax=Flavobacterium sp. TaxID=239 RepID=UPI00122AFE00|nr:hypothetical protein [Flavobacterium sp.]RZJ71202.1 MAG: hypothetical protein EOO49_10650 [Flavobacterium sp.]
MELIYWLSNIFMICCIALPVFFWVKFARRHKRVVRNFFLIGLACSYTANVLLNFLVGFTIAFIPYSDGTTFGEPNQALWIAGIAAFSRVFSMGLALLPLRIMERKLLIGASELERIGNENENL